MQPVPYLFFDGTCRAAVETYATVFGAEIEMMSTFGEMPASGEMTVPEGMDGRIMHASLRWPDGGQLMASDRLHDPAAPATGEGVHVSMTLPTLDAARTAFDALAAGGEVGMPFGPTFWSEGFGTVRDRFGTRWMITAEGAG